MALHPDQLDDFIKNTFPIIRKDKWKDISLDNQHYIVAETFLDKAKMPTSGGQYLQEQLQTRNTGTYEHTGWFGQSSVKVADLTQVVQVPWAMVRVSMAYSIYEDAWQQGPQRILSVLKVRKHSMYNDLTTGLESDLWGAPTGPTQTPRRPYGLAYWLTRGTASQKDFGFNGGNPTGFSDCAGLNATTYRQWRSGTFLYDSFSQNDFYSKLTEATIKCNFQPPRSYAELDGGKPDYILFTTYPVIEQFHLAQTAGNDNLRMDVGKYRTTPMFRGIPIRYVPALTNSTSPVYDSTNPILGLNRKTWKMIGRAGKERYMHDPMRDSNQPDTRKVFLDMQFNWMITDRRSNFIGYQAVS